MERRTDAVAVALSALARRTDAVHPPSPSRLMGTVVPVRSMPNCGKVIDRSASSCASCQTVVPEQLQVLYGPIVASLRETFGERLKTVVLFGSQARGEATVSSDHDLLVVAEDLPRQPLARQRAVRLTLQPVLDLLPGAVSFIAKTPDEVAANLTPLLLDVCADGLCLWGGDYFEPLREKALTALRQAGLRRPALGGGWRWLLPGVPERDWELTWEGYRERA